MELKQVSRWKQLYRNLVRTVADFISTDAKFDIENEDKQLIDSLIKFGELEIKDVEYEFTRQGIRNILKNANRVKKNYARKSRRVGKQK